MLIELFGYLGSTLVVVSMLMSSVVKLRVINTVGSIISGTYALIIGSFPLALMNICLIIINLYNLRRLSMTEKHYELIDGEKEEAFFDYFLSHYLDDIRIFFPEFRGQEAGINAAYMICCDAEPAGILLGKKSEKGEMEILLEYTTPTYRDCSVGKFLYSKLPGKGIRRLICNGKGEKHVPYLKKMGYTAENGRYLKSL